MPHLVVESALVIKVVEEISIRLAAPEVHIGNLEVTPDCDCQEMHDWEVGSEKNLQ